MPKKTFNFNMQIQIYSIQNWRNIITEIHTKYGTAQGSIISPLPFLIMINGQPDPLNDVESSLFADDAAYLNLTVG